MKYLLGGLALLGLCATQAAAETWHSYSRSAGSVFMADVDSIVVEGEITRVLVATVARTGDAGDYSHTIETFEFQCGSNSRWRTAGMVEYGPDGAEMGRYPEEGAEWELVRANTSPTTSADTGAGDTARARFSARRAPRSSPAPARCRC